MARSTDEKRNATSVADLLFLLPERGMREELEDYRVRWEAQNRQKTDITRRYTSMLPAEEQRRMFQRNTIEYFQGLPLFVQDYILERMEAAKARGTLEQMPREYVAIFLEGAMARPSRGR